MNLFTYFAIPLLAILLSIVDTSFLSFHELFGASVISSFAILLIIALLGYRKQSLLFGAAAVLALSTFSSLPVWALICAYLLIPTLIFYIKDKIFFDNNLPALAVIILISNLIFRLLMLPLSTSIGGELIVSVLFYPVLNLIVSIILLAMIKKVLIFFNP